MSDQIILRVIARWNIPFMVVFGMYVITHGELGPGGGFQGGVVLAAAFLVYGLVYGAEAMRRIVPRALTDAAAVLGVLVYTGIGVYAVLRGRSFLDHRALVPGDPDAAEPLGMMLAEYGVGLTVAAVMITIFNEITEPSLGSPAAGRSASDALPDEGGSPPSADPPTGSP